MAEVERLVERYRAVLGDEMGLTVHAVDESTLAFETGGLNLLIFLEDHKAETLLSVTAAVNRFNEEYDTGDVEFVMAAGNSGIEAATNDVVSRAQYKMLAWVYGVVAFLVLLAFLISMNLLAVWLRRRFERRW